MMRILFISQYFPPEMGAPSARVYELSRRWVEKGHEITVLTTFPNHPTGIVPPEYRGKVWEIGEKDGIRVVRTFLYAAANKGIAKRSLSYVSFMASALMLGPFLTRRPDLVLATSPQFLVALAGLGLSLVKWRPLVLEIRDIWPDSIVAVGALPEGHIAIRALHVLERFLYRRSRAVCVVTRSFKRELSERGVAPERMKVVTNGVDLERFRPPADRARLRADLGFEGRFVCLYVGTIGMAHGLETILDAAEKASRVAPSALFVLVGEGARRQEIEAEAGRRRLANVRFLGQRPRDEIPALLGAADVALVLLRKTPLFKTVIPSKLFEAMGTATPILLGVEGEAAEILREAGAGRAVPPEDASALLEAIVTLQRDPELRERLGRAGRETAERLYDRNVLADDYATWLESVTCASRPGR